MTDMTDMTGSWVIGRTRARERGKQKIRHIRHAFAETAENGGFLEISEFEPDFLWLQVEKKFTSTAAATGDN